MADHDPPHNFHLVSRASRSWWFTICDDSNDLYWPCGCRGFTNLRHVFKHKKKGPWTLVSVLFSKLVTRNIFWDLLNFRAWGICSIYTPHPSRLRTYDWPWTKRVPPKSGSLVVQESPHLQWPHNPYNQQPKGSRRNCFSPGRCRNPKAHVARTAPHLCDAPQGRVLGAWTHYTRAMWLSTRHHLLFRSIRHYQIYQALLISVR